MINQPDLLEIFRYFRNYKYYREKSYYLPYKEYFNKIYLALNLKFQNNREIILSRFAILSELISGYKSIRYAWINPYFRYFFEDILEIIAYYIIYKIIDKYRLQPLEIIAVRMEDIDKEKAILEKRGIIIDNFIFKKAIKKEKILILYN